MKKFVVFFLYLFFCSSFLSAQITTTRVVTRVEETVEEPYDGSLNFLGEDVNKYIGQELYLKGVNESLRQYGYKGFFTTFIPVSQEVYQLAKDSINVINYLPIYKCCDGYNSIYSELEGKYFSVINVHNHPKVESNKYLYGDKFYLELIEKESGDTIFYEYDSSFEYGFPFIVVEFYNTQKALNIGREFVVRGRNWISDEEMTDMFTGDPVNFVAGGKWTAIDLTIEERFYTLSLIIENSKGEKIPLSVEYIDKPYFVFDASVAERYQNKFGAGNWQKILEGKVEIGFTEEMVKLSWGEPNKVNRASYGDQWVYDDQNLYFENGRLKAFN